MALWPSVRFGVKIRPDGLKCEFRYSPRTGHWSPALLSCDALASATVRVELVNRIMQPPVSTAAEPIENVRLRKLRNAGFRFRRAGERFSNSAAVSLGKRYDCFTSLAMTNAAREGATIDPTGKSLRICRSS